MGQIDFNAVVQKRMEELQLSKSELARRMGVTPEYIIMLLHGNRRWNLDMMNLACEALDLKAEFRSKKRKLA